MTLKPVFIISCLLFILSGTLSAAGDADAGKNKASSCVSCHGTNGEGMGANPRISGMGIEQYSQALQSYKTGAKKNMMIPLYKILKKILENS